MTAESNLLVLPARVKLWLGSSALLAVLCHSAAAAENNLPSRPPGVTPVYELARPSYDSAKIEVGSFLLAPSFVETMEGNDNIFASDLRQFSDLIITTREDLNLSSQWQLGGLTMHLTHSHQWYTRHNTENANIYGLDGEYSVDLAEGVSLAIDAGILQQPQQRNSAEADRLSLSRPLYNSIPVSAVYVQDWGRWHHRAEIGFVQTAYISNRDAARSAMQARFSDRVSYALAGDSWSFLQVNYSTQDWRLKGDQRNFNSLSVVAGLNVQIADVVDLELGAGVQRQHYLFSGFDDLVEPTFNGHLIWNVLPLTTLSASARQSVTGLETFCDNALGNPACVGLSAGLLSKVRGARGALEVTLAEIGLQHEIWHDILGEVRFRFEQDKFDPVDLVDRNYFLDFGTRFLLNRNLELNMSYALNIRSANQNLLLYNSGPYQANMVSLALKAAL